MRIWLRARETAFFRRLVPYCHVTPDVMPLWYPGMSLSAAQTWLKRLRQAGYLESEPLDHKRRYYRLTLKAVLYLRRRKGVRVSRAATRPLKPYRKPEKHAFLLYCSQPSQVPRQPYRPSMDAERFPDIAEYIASGKADPLRQKLFYAADRLVGYFVLDRGHPNFLLKLKRKIEALFDEQKGKSFCALLPAAQFCLTIVTCSPSRRSELETQLRHEQPGFPWELVVMEQIADLLPRR